MINYKSSALESSSAHYTLANIEHLANIVLLPILISVIKREYNWSTTSYTFANGVKRSRVIPHYSVIDYTLLWNMSQSQDDT